MRFYLSTSRLRLPVIFCLLVVAAAFAPSDAAGAPSKDPYDLPEPVAIQNRKYEMSQSVILSAGYIPTDSFNRGYTFAAGYRYALKPFLIWEVLNYPQVANKETQLKKDLTSLNLQVQNVGLGGVLDWPKQIYMTGFHYAPFYSKSLMFNSTLVFSEMSLFLGAGSLNFNITGQKPMIAPGINSRTYVSENFAINAYFRDYFYKDDAVGINGIIDFGIGIEYGFKLFGGGS